MLISTGAFAPDQHDDPVLGGKVLLYFEQSPFTNI